MSFPKYLLACFIAAFVLLASIPGAGVTVQMLLSGPAAGAPPASPITFYWGAEATPFTDAQSSVGSSTGTFNGSPTRDSTIVKVATYSAYFTGFCYNLFDAASNIDANQGSVGGWFYCNGVGDYRVIFRADNASDALYVIGMNSGQIRWIYTTAGGVGVDQTTTGQPGWTANAWYWFEMHWNKGTSTYSLNVYDAADSLVVSDTSSAATGSLSGAWTGIAIGDVFNQGYEMHYDNYMISSSSTTDIHALRNSTSP